VSRRSSLTIECQCPDAGASQYSSLKTSESSWPTLFRQPDEKHFLRALRFPPPHHAKTARGGGPGAARQPAAQGSVHFAWDPALSPSAALKTRGARARAGLLSFAPTGAVVSHVIPVSTSFSERYCGTSRPLTGSENGDVSWRFFTPCPQNPSKKPPEIPMKYPFNSPTIFPRPANPLASNHIPDTLGAERLVTWRRAWLKMDPKNPENTPPRLGPGSSGVESQLQSEEA